MPDLSEAAVSTWFAETHPVTAKELWPPPIRAVEEADDIPAHLIELGDLLDRIAASDPAALVGALTVDPLHGELQQLLAQLGAARAMRLIHWIAEASLPEHGPIIAALVTGETQDVRALRAVVTTVARRSTVHRMFAPDRLAALQDALTKESI